MKELAQVQWKHGGSLESEKEQSSKEKVNSSAEEVSRWVVASTLETKTERAYKSTSGREFETCHYVGSTKLTHFYSKRRNWTIFGGKILDKFYRFNWCTVMWMQ